MLRAGTEKSGDGSGTLLIVIMAAWVGLCFAHDEFSLASAPIAFFPPFTNKLCTYLLSTTVRYHVRFGMAYKKNGRILVNNEERNRENHRLLVRNACEGESNVVENAMVDKYYLVPTPIDKLRVMFMRSGAWMCVWGWFETWHVRTLGTVRTMYGTVPQRIFKAFQHYNGKALPAILACC